MQALKDALDATPKFFKSLPKEKWAYRYAPDKWSVKEVLQHITDSERVFAYRALRIARNDKTALPGFDDKLLAASARADRRTPRSLLAEYRAERNATIHLFESLAQEDLDHIGVAGDSPTSALALGYIIAGHELHHLDLIRERYL